VLRLAPADFWAATPRELAAAIAALSPRRDAAMTRGALAGLMRKFPD
jgi:uncharacterized phage protein (TIGR02216 family)